MTEQTAPEPTMEEILASIRRIITEDDPGTISPPSVKAAETTADAAPRLAVVESPEPHETSALEPPATQTEPHAPELEPAPEPVAESIWLAPVVPPKPPIEPSHASKAPPVFEMPASDVPAMESRSIFAPAADPAPPPAAQEQPIVPESPLVGAVTAAASASAFGRLSEAVKVSSLEDAIMMPVSGRTLEDVVTEMLRPMLQAWLDENLAEIVRQQVDEEVARIARSRVG